MHSNNTPNPHTKGERKCVPITVVIPVRNEALHVGRCLRPLIGWAEDVVVVDSGSTDGTAAVCNECGARVVQFVYTGGWPKKRQWALDTLDLKSEWILLLDSDEILDENIKSEIELSIARKDYDGYYLKLEIVFLGRQLRFGDTHLNKLSLFRRGLGRYECRLSEQTQEMSDIEVHEHVVVAGKVGSICAPVRHENINSLHRYIEKHNEYSTWEALVYTENRSSSIEPKLFGTQAERRRWYKVHMLSIPGIPLVYFAYLYLWRLGIVDGKAGLVYCSFRAVQMFHIKAKLLEMRMLASRKR